MRQFIFFLTIIVFAACSKDEDPTPPCIQVPERSINLEDSLTIINCNDYALGVHVEGETEYYSTIDYDTLYLHFDTTGTFIVNYYNARELPALDDFHKFTVVVE